jgi:cytochrome c peroxidase
VAPVFGATFSPFTMKKQLIISALALVSVVFGCKKDETEQGPSYEFRKPENFPEPTYTFDNNPVTEAGFKLGKKLFFDPILSVDNTVSCNNCHNQSLAFADLPLHAFSKGVMDRQGTRNAPQLVNLAFMKEFFWDGGVTHLDFVPLTAIESEVEMDEEIENVISKLNNHADYPALFKAAFGTDEINTPLMLHALSQFTNLMVSNNAPYDKYLRGETALSEQELEGQRLFEQKCQSCHSGILFTDESYRNNGIDSVFTDIGRARITAFDGDIGKFRVPSLRNVGITRPYMHNAKFATLEEVLDHYSDGIIESPSLDPSLKNGIPMTAEEKAAIIAFLKTLTDKEFTQDERFFKG